MSDFSFEVPATLRGIKLNQWQRYIDVYEKNYKYFQDSAQNLFLSESFIQEYCATLFNNVDSFSHDENTMVPNNYVTLQKDTLYNTIINTRLQLVTGW